MASTSSDADTPTTVDDWFDNVENIKPLRGGRKGDTLNEVARCTNKYSAEQAEEKFRTELENARKNEDDPLSVMCNYVSWFEEHFPSGKQRLFYPMVYTVLSIYSVMEIYKNDDRILKLWIKLAESFPESGFAVMEFAFTKGSCRQMASFYIQWSNMYQAVGWWNRAREKLELGIKMCATPLPNIYAAQDELEATALRVSIKESQESDSDEGEPEAFGAGSNRKTLGMLRALGRRKMPPIFRHPQGPPGKIAKTPMTPAQKSFDVFMDPTPEANLKANSIVKKGNRIADELRDDPDYQALFGFFDDREKIDLHLTNEENMSKSSKKMAQCKAPSILVNPIEEPCYEVYGDEDNHTEQSKAPKARLMLKKMLVKTSIEEEYAFRLYPKVR